LISCRKFVCGSSGWAVRRHFCEPSIYFWSPIFSTLCTGRWYLYREGTVITSNPKQLSSDTLIWPLKCSQDGTCFCYIYKNLTKIYWITSNFNGQMGESVCRSSSIEVMTGILPNSAKLESYFCIIYFFSATGFHLIIQV